MSIGGQSDAKAERKTYQLTPEGFARKHERLEYLRTVKRKEVADYIHEAKEAGDISESSAYEEAKHEQAKVEGAEHQARPQCHVVVACRHAAGPPAHAEPRDHLHHPDNQDEQDQRVHG